MAEPDFVTRDQHRGDLAELRLELANTLASLDKRTELIAQDLASRTDRLAQDLASLRRETDTWRTDMHRDMSELRHEMRALRTEMGQEMRAWRQSTARQVWVMISVVTAAVLSGLIRFVFFP